MHGTQPTFSVNIVSVDTQLQGCTDSNPVLFSKMDVVPAELHPSKCGNMALQHWKGFWNFFEPMNKDTVEMDSMDSNCEESKVWTE